MANTPASGTLHTIRDTFTWEEVDFEAADVKLESPAAAVELKLEPAAANPEPAPSKYSIIFRALLPVPEAKIAIWIGAADEKEGAADEKAGAADETDDEVGAADAVEGAATVLKEL